MIYDMIYNIIYIYMKGLFLCGCCGLSKYIYIQYNILYFILYYIMYVWNMCPYIYMEGDIINILYGNNNTHNKKERHFLMGGIINIYGGVSLIFLMK